MISRGLRQYLLLLVVSLLMLIVALLQYGSKINAPPFLRKLYQQELCDAECINSTLKSTRKPHYLVHTRGCLIPNIGPSHPSIASWRLREPDKLVCSGKEPLTEEAPGLMLRFYPDRYWQQGIASPSAFNCSYRGIVRLTDKRSKFKDESVPITEVLTPIDEDGIYVTCTNKSKTTKRDNNNNIFYKNIHYFIQPRRVKEKRNIQMKKGPRGSRPDQLSVIAMGLDAVARGNFIRHLPRSYHYLTHDLQAIDMRGFTKVGHNTYPNIVATLMGISNVEIAEHSCLPTRKNSHYDDCPFIWKNFSDKGYATAFAEDAQWMGTFHYTRSGFIKEPTDYYNAPYFYASDRNIGHSARRGGNGYVCQGGKMSLRVIYDYSLAIAEALQDIPYFGFSWASAMTHDSFPLSSAADEPTLEYLQKLHDGGYLEHTILFLLSDHGKMYMGSLRSTYGGQLEHKMPFMMVVLPPWFRDQYPDAVNNMNINSGRLTGHFDLYATLQDIANRAYANLSNSYVGKTKGQSLFQEIPPERTCEDAGISTRFCTCQNTTEADPKDPYFLGSINHTINEINQGLNKFKECKQLSLLKVLGGTVSSPSNISIPTKLDTVIVTYDIKFTTQPGGAQIESSVLYDNYTHVYELVSEVSRINDNDQWKHCIQNVTYGKFCYCKT